MFGILCHIPLVVGIAQVYDTAATDPGSEWKHYYSDYTTEAYTMAYTACSMTPMHCHEGMMHQICMVEAITKTCYFGDNK